MNRGFVISLVAGLAVAVLIIGGVLSWRSGDRLEPTGQILKLRSAPVDEQHCLVVLDLRLINGSNIALEIREVSVSLEDKDGVKFPGTLVSGVDTKSLFSYYPVLGEAFNAPLIANTRINPHQTVDLMLAARLDLSESDLASRRKLSVLAQDRSGATVELVEKRK